MRFQGAINAIGVRFYPGGAYPFVRVPMSELTGQIVPLREIGLGVSANRLDRLAEADDPQDKVSVLQHFLVSRAANLDARESQAIHALSLIQAGGGLMNIETLARRIGTNRRNLERQFGVHVGLTGRPVPGMR